MEEKPIDKESDSCEGRGLSSKDEESDSEMSEPGDDEANRSAECKESPKSIAYIGECLRFEIVDLFYAQKGGLDELGIRLRSDNLSVLYEVLYKLNIELIQSDRFPHALLLGSAKQVYVAELLRLITSFIIKKFALIRKHLVRVAELSFQLPKKGGSDFAIFKKVKSKKYILAVVSCKSACPDVAVEEAVDCAKAAYMINGDGKTVYAFATNCIAFRLLSYNPADQSAAKEGGFKMSKQFDYLFVGMHEERNRERWLKDNTEIVRVIYSILCDKLAL